MTSVSAGERPFVISPRQQPSIAPGFFFCFFFSLPSPFSLFTKLFPHTRPFSAFLVCTILPLPPFWYFVRVLPFFFFFFYTIQVLLCHKLSCYFFAKWSHSITSPFFLLSVIPSLFFFWFTLYSSVCCLFPFTFPQTFFSPQLLHAFFSSLHPSPAPFIIRLLSSNS